MDTRLGLSAALARHVEAKGPIVIGLAGAGQMGTDMIVQIALLDGLMIGAIADMRPEAARKALELARHYDDDIVSAARSSEIDDAIKRGRIAVTDDASLLAEAGLIDVVIDATGHPEFGTSIALKSMAAKKHVVMLNVEADITIGRYLKSVAKKEGVVYTGAAGDEPACTLELITFAQSLGLEIVAAGKGKNNPLKIDAMPEDYEAEAKARDMNARMLVEFIDGSKTMIEMVAIANATGLVPDKPGMHGPKASLKELAGILCTKADGGWLERSGCVDYSIGKGVAPGVFCIVKPRHERITERMIDLKVGPGPCFALVRPYHLTSLEVPLSAARAVLFDRPDMQPIDHPVAECATLAKRDLAPGERLGKIGERDYRGWAMTWEEARSAEAVPLGLIEGAVVTQPIAAGALITSAKVTPDQNLLVTQIRKELDQQDAAFLSP